MRPSQILRIGGGLAAIVIIAGVGIATRQLWLPWFDSAGKESTAEITQTPVEEPKMLKLTSQARKNLGLVSKPAATQEYWRTLQVPGLIVDRPGISDRGITSPAVGVVTRVHAFAGDTVKPGEVLFSLRLFSEYLQNTQSELFKATRETELIKEERARLQGIATSGAIAGSRIIEMDQRIRRQEGLIQAYRQDLLTRGLLPAQIDQISKGTFVSTINIHAPPLTGTAGDEPTVKPVSFMENITNDGLVYEVQELKVDLGQQVQAGQLLSVLSNHRSLYLEGHAFKQEAPLIEKAAQNGWPINVEFADDDHQQWPAIDQPFQIRHVANTIDEASRTFDFFIPLNNQSRTYERDGETFVVWRLRPGQRVRLHVPVERMENVFVLPAAALVREGPEAYVFRQNGDLFKRLPVNVIHEDRLHVVLANDGSIGHGSYLANGSAASLNRVLKAQAASGMRADVHVHADGTVHAAH